MRSYDFWTTSVAMGVGGTPTESSVLDTKFLEAVSKGPSARAPDIEVAVALARFVHEGFEAFGTDGRTQLVNQDAAAALSALKALLRRLNITHFDPPFRDFETFNRHWKSVGASGSGGWQARRKILDAEFEPLHESLAIRKAGSIHSTLANPISPLPATGWPRVDEEISEMRRHFDSAATEQDYRNVGNDCVAIIEALSGTVYDHAVHGEPNIAEPPKASTKDRLDRYIEISLPGKDKAELPKLARATIELAQATKHRPSGSRVAAGITADATLLLANLLRRIQT